MKKLFSVLIVLISLTSFSQDETFKQIEFALKTGNAKELVKYFNSSVELTIDNESNYYSKAQSEMILKDFFNKNITKSFEIVHKGDKETAKYLIGKLTTSDKAYRVYIYLKKDSNRYIIQEISFTNN